jgi:hypothetical protein
LTVAKRIRTAFACGAGLCYRISMNPTTTRAMPAPIPPTEAELEAWSALTREEQIARYREYLSHSDCNRVSDATVAEVLNEARGRVASRRRG